MNVADELARLGIRLNAEEAAAWKGIKVPRKPGEDDRVPELSESGRPYNWPRAETGE